MKSYQFKLLHSPNCFVRKKTESPGETHPKELKKNENLKFAIAACGIIVAEDVFFYQEIYFINTKGFKYGRFSKCLVI